MTDNMQMHQVFAPAENVLMSDAGNMKVLMSMDKGQFIELNATGRAIWERLDGKRSLSEITEELQRIYEIPQDRCKTEVLGFVSDLRDHSLVEQKG